MHRVVQEYNMIPVELITMGISAIGGFMAQSHANAQEDRHVELMSISGSVKEARGDTSGKWIRLAISITLLLLLSFVMVAPAFMDTHVTLVEQGWLWTTTTEIKGILYDDTFRLMLISMSAFYLGRSPATR